MSYEPVKISLEQVEGIEVEADGSPNRTARPKEAAQAGSVPGAPMNEPTAIFTPWALNDE